MTAVVAPGRDPTTTSAALLASTQHGIYESHTDGERDFIPGYDYDSDYRYFARTAVPYSSDPLDQSSPSLAAGVEVEVLASCGPARKWRQVKSTVRGNLFEGEVPLECLSFPYPPKRKVLPPPRPLPGARALFWGVIVVLVMLAVLCVIPSMVQHGLQEGLELQPGCTSMKTLGLQIEQSDNATEKEKLMNEANILTCEIKQYGIPFTVPFMIVVIGVFFFYTDWWSLFRHFCCDKMGPCQQCITGTAQQAEETKDELVNDLNDAVQRPQYSFNAFTDAKNRLSSSLSPWQRLLTFQRDSVQFIVNRSSFLFAIGTAAFIHQPFQRTNLVVKIVEVVNATTSINPSHAYIFSKPGQPLQPADTANECLMLNSWGGYYGVENAPYFLFGWKNVCLFGLGLFFLALGEMLKLEQGSWYFFQFREYKLPACFRQDSEEEEEKADDVSIAFSASPLLPRKLPSDNDGNLDRTKGGEKYRTTEGTMQKNNLAGAYWPQAIQSFALFLWGPIFLLVVNDNYCVKYNRPLKDEQPMLQVLNNWTKPAQAFGLMEEMDDFTFVYTWQLSAFIISMAIAGFGIFAFSLIYMCKRIVWLEETLYHFNFFILRTIQQSILDPLTVGKKTNVAASMTARRLRATGQAHLINSGAARRLQESTYMTTMIGEGVAGRIASNVHTLCWAFRTQTQASSWVRATSTEPLQQDCFKRILLAAPVGALLGALLGFQLADNCVEWRWAGYGALAGFFASEIMMVFSAAFSQCNTPGVELAVDQFASIFGSMEERSDEFSGVTEDTSNPSRSRCAGFLLLLFSGAAISGGVLYGDGKPEATVLCSSAASLDGMGFEVKGNFDPVTGVLSASEAERSLNVVIGKTVSTTDSATGAQSVLGNHVSFDNPLMSETFAGGLPCNGNDVQGSVRVRVPGLSSSIMSKRVSAVQQKKRESPVLVQRSCWLWQ
jgi:hypothetical protein